MTIKNFFIFILLSVIVLTSCTKKAEKIKSLQDLKNKRIGILTGSAGDKAAREMFRNAKFIDMMGAADAALNVKTNKSDGFVHTEIILKNLVKKQPGLTVLTPPLAQVSIAAAFKKGNHTLRDKVNIVLKKLKENGTIASMKKKWINSDYESAPSLPVLKNSGENGTLKMGTFALSEPFSFVSENILTGFHIELALRIGAELGFKIEMTDMNFESLIPALQSGKIDFAMSDFNVTEERKNFVDFSETYLTNNISALVRK